jgi:hydroxyethylthiazole kinase-like uncharacterized protein yjeF
MTAPCFALPPILEAERLARAFLERLLPRAGERLAIGSVACDQHAFEASLARLMQARGTETELFVWEDEDKSHSHALFDCVCESARRSGVVVTAMPEDSDLPDRTAGIGLYGGRWDWRNHSARPRGFWRRLADALIGKAALDSEEESDGAWDIHWPGDPGDGMLRKLGLEEPVMTCDEVRAADERAINELGVPGLVLMEHAGIGAAKVARELLVRRGVSPGDGRYALVVAGGGNNGGDAMVVARGLLEQGYGVRLALLADPGWLPPDAKANMEILSTSGFLTPDASSWRMEMASAQLAGNLPKADLVVDGLLGTGAKGKPRGAVREAIQAINAMAARGVPVLALDLPSGLDGDSGRAAEATVRATATVTFAAVKPGLLRADGPAHAGVLFIADIGVMAGTF